MKKTTILLLILLLSCSCFAQNKRTDWLKLKLQGKVKSLKETSNFAIEENGEVLKGKRLWAVDDIYYLFNNTGRLLEKKTSQADTNRYEKITYKYNEKDSIVEETRYDTSTKTTLQQETSKYDGTGNLIESKEYTNGVLEETFTCIFDDDGNRVEETLFNIYGGYKKNFLKYDLRGNAIEIATYYSEGILSEINTYKFNDNNKIIKINRLNSDGVLTAIHTFKYNDKGETIEKNILNSDGSLKRRSMRKYDDKGNKVEESYIEKDSIIRLLHIYKYNIKGNRVEVWDYELNDNDSSRVLSYITIYNDKGYKIAGKFNDLTPYFDFTTRYDDYGNELETIWYNPNGSVNTVYAHKYDYDQNGNWTKWIKFMQGKPQFVKERVITYY